jgi:hypothetical protein
LGASEERTPLFTYRLGQFERARNPANLAKPMGEDSLGFRLEPTPALFASHPSESSALSSGERIPVRVRTPADFCRKSTVVTCHRERCAGSSAVLLVSLERPPLRPVVDPLLVDDESTVFADGFDGIGGDLTIPLWTLVGGFALYVFIERRLVDGTTRRISRLYRGPR